MEWTQETPHSESGRFMNHQSKFGRRKWKDHLRYRSTGVEDRLTRQRRQWACIFVLGVFHYRGRPVVGTGRPVSVRSAFCFKWINLNRWIKFGFYHLGPRFWPPKSVFTPFLFSFLLSLSLALFIFFFIFLSLFPSNLDLPLDFGHQIWTSLTEEL